MKIQDYTAKNVISVPVITLQNDDKGKFVMAAVPEDGKLVAKKKPVVIGKLYGENAEILEGLKSGDQIITDGFQGLYDGQAITTSVQ